MDFDPHGQLRGAGGDFPFDGLHADRLSDFGISRRSSAVVKAHKDLRDFFVPIDDMIRVQPCLSPVWDTGIAMHALAETGIEHGAPEIQSA
jgi:squalene-hopene/tetraprenyl-beta-curcumene cyclase